MARLEVEGCASMMQMLESMADSTIGICKKGVYEGARVVADAIDKQIDLIPTEEVRHGTNSDPLVGISSAQKSELHDALGITKIDVNSRGFINAKVGFDGYSKSTSSPKFGGAGGMLPLPLLAAAVNSGASFRRKNPFLRKAVNQSEKEALAAMEKVVEEEIKKHNL